MWHYAYAFTKGALLFRDKNLKKVDCLVVVLAINTQYQPVIVRTDTRH